MPQLQSLPWIHPLEFVASIQQNPAIRNFDWVFLYSGIRTAYSGRYSYLACNPLETIRAADVTKLAAKLSSDCNCFDNAWFGYLGYGLKNTLENLKTDSKNWFSLPDLTMIRFGTIIQFDHDLQQISAWSDSTDVPMPEGYLDSEPTLTEVLSLASNMTKQGYMEKVAAIIERIHNGELYQANLTRKFQGVFNKEPSSFSLFRKLCAASPAVYSAFLKLGDVSILSSSPEQFMAIDAHGNMQTRPIKGTAPRFSDPVQDLQSLQQLASSSKDRAENLMIVDLMRNDFSRSCLRGSVVTQSLFDITSHATVHHLSSTVTGRKAPNCTSLAAVAHCFPPGSMTGAPKIRAINLCSEYEQIERGIYSGAIGWFGGDGSAELSVVIRTLIIKGDRFEFQVGGGIVADSDPEREWLETIDKSKGILLALNLSTSALHF